MYVYADVVLAINLIMNGLILTLTAWLAGIRYRFWRVFAAAACGSVYALGEVWPALALGYTMPAKLTVSVLLVILAYGLRPVKSIIVLTACFYVTSLILGGAVLGWLFLADSSGLATGVNWRQVTLSNLTAGSVIGLILVLAAARRVQSGAVRRKTLYPVILSFAGRQITLTAKLDTGNELFTPAGRHPVVLIEQKALVPLLSPEVNSFLSGRSPGNWLADLDQCFDQLWLSRIQAIPYRGLGTASMLLGFRPDRLSVVTSKGSIETDCAVIGITSGKLAADGSYAALLHPALFSIVNDREGAGICA